MVRHATLVWALIAIMAALTCVSFLLTGLGVALGSNPALFAFIGLLFTINRFYRTVRIDQRLQTMSECTTQIMLVLLFGILLTYAATATNFPYRDAELQMIDKLVGFERRPYLKFFEARPWLSDLIGYAYLALLPQFALVPLLLVAGGQVERLNKLLLAIGCALLLTSAIAVFVPAVDAFVYLDLAPMPAAEAAKFKTQVPTLEALRAGTMHTVQLNDLEGLITFPSFHTAGGLLLAWSMLAIPYLRWPALALNGALIAATPVFGAHYFIDVIGGTAVAAVSLAITAWLCRLARPAAIATVTESTATNDDGRALARP